MSNFSSSRYKYFQQDVPGGSAAGLQKEAQERKASSAEAKMDLSQGIDTTKHIAIRTLLLSLLSQLDSLLSPKDKEAFDLAGLKSVFQSIPVNGQRFETPEKLSAMITQVSNAVNHALIHDESMTPDQRERMVKQLGTIEGLKEKFEQLNQTVVNQNYAPGVQQAPAQATNTYVPPASKPPVPRPG